MLADFNWMQAVSSPVMMVLIACSIVTFGIVFERSWYFWTRRGNADDAAAALMRRIRGGQLKEAEEICHKTEHPFGAVAARLFETASKTENVYERLHVALSQQKLLFEKNLNVLGTMAAIAPLLGLLGTVWGIMRAFHDMARAGSAAPSVVAAGVAEALVTTAAGLVVALPALILYNHFTRRMNVMLTIAENHTRNVRVVLVEYESKSAQGKTASRQGAASRSEAAPLG